MKKTFLSQIQQEIFDVEKNIELLRKAIIDKSPPMKVAHTRLEARTHRRNIENCHDFVQDRLFFFFKFFCRLFEIFVFYSLVKEVKHMNQTIDCLHRKLQETEAQHQQLLKTRSSLETELQSKVNALFIDREKCMGMRRSFPITATIKY